MSGLFFGSYHPTACLPLSTLLCSSVSGSLILHYGNLNRALDKPQSLCPVNTCFIYHLKHSFGLPVSSDRCKQNTKFVFRIIYSASEMKGEGDKQGPKNSRYTQLCYDTCFETQICSNTIELLGDDWNIVHFSFACARFRLQQTRGECKHCTLLNQAVEEWTIYTHTYHIHPGLAFQGSGIHRLKRASGDIKFKVFEHCLGISLVGLDADE